MPTTTNAALRYPALTNVPNVPADLANLANDVDAQLGPAGAWNTYTPTWATSGTGSVQPSLGNGVITARHRKMGRLCFVNVDIVMGSTTNAGVGAMTITLPFQARSGSRQIIHLSVDTNNTALNGTITWGGHARVETAATSATLFASAADANSSLRPMASANGSATVGTGNPTIPSQFTFGPNCRITITGAYETAA